MATSRRLFAATVIAALAGLPVAIHAAKANKKTKPAITVKFEAHNEGAGPIYGDENVISVTIDSAGIRYQGKGIDKPYSITWDQLSGWQGNKFTSYSSGRAAGGDFGIGIYQNPRYFSFRTRNGHDYAAAIKALRVYASSKERTGIG